MELSIGEAVNLTRDREKWRIVSCQAHRQPTADGREKGEGVPWGLGLGWCWIFFFTFCLMLNIFLYLTIWLSFCLGDFCRRLLHVTALNPLCRLRSTSAPNWRVKQTVERRKRENGGAVVAERDICGCMRPHGIERTILDCFIFNPSRGRVLQLVRLLISDRSHWTGRWIQVRCDCHFCALEIFLLTYNKFAIFDKCIIISRKW